MIAALLISAALTAGAVDTTPPTRDALIRDVTEYLLNGESLPADMDARLMALPPADRIEVLIFMRRSGMMTGPGWTAERLLAPARTGEQPK